MAPSSDTTIDISSLTQHSKPVAISVTVSNASEKEKNHRGQRRTILFGYLPCINTSCCSREVLGFSAEKELLKSVFPVWIHTCKYRLGSYLFAFLEWVPILSCTDSLAQKVN